MTFASSYIVITVSQLLATCIENVVGNGIVQISRRVGSWVPILIQIFSIL
jgi:hypothetical protein